MVERISVEKLFIFFSLVFGLVYVFILPPFQSVDEASHFYRSYGIISNSPLAQKIDNQVGDYLPASLEKLASKYDFLIKNIDKKIDAKYILDSAQIKLNPSEIKFINFQNTAIYSPVCYLTQMPGMYIAKAVGASPLVIFYVGRLSNLLFFTLITYFAIKIMPFYKLTMMLLALMPMTLSLAGALTSDVMVIGLNFLWVAVLLRLIFENKKINNLHIAGLISLALILALCKHYFLLIPLIFLLPSAKFKTNRGYFVCILGTLLVSVVGILFWQNIVNGLYVDLNANANASAQLAFILKNPLSYLAVILKTLIVKIPRIIITMVGVLGWQDTRLDFMTYILYPMMILLSIAAEKPHEFKFEGWQKLILVLDIIFAVFVIFTTMYLMWSQVGSPVIYGLNGKYFIPLMLPILLLFYNKIKISFPYAKPLIYFLLILILVSSDLSIIHRFYEMTPNLYYKI